MPDTMVTTYTTAPQVYDGFGTYTVAVVGTARNLPIREVRTPEQHAEWQRSRYSSGLFFAWTTDDEEQVGWLTWEQGKSTCRVTEFENPVEMDSIPYQSTLIAALRALRATCQRRHNETTDPRVAESMQASIDDAQEALNEIQAAKARV